VIQTPRCTLSQIRERARIMRPANSRRIASVALDANGWEVRAGDDVAAAVGIVDDCTPGSWAQSTPVETAEPTEVSRALTEQELKSFDLRTFARQAQLLAREIDRDAWLVLISTRRSGAQTYYTFNVKGSCIHVTVARGRAEAIRSKDCPKQRSPIAVPNCSLSQLLAKHPNLDLFKWTGTWFGTKWDLSQRTDIEDDC
jgi:hypothetical protein